MDDKSLSHLLSLCSGFNPFTGEILPDDHIIRDPRILIPLKELVGQKKPKIIDDRCFPIPNRTGLHWTQQEDSALEAAFINGLMGIEVLSLAHGRTEEAIKSRLKKLGVYCREDEDDNAF